MSNELLGIDKFLYQTLTGDATLVALIGARIYSDLAPQGTLFPYIVYSCLSALDITGGFAARVFTKPLVMVKAIGKNSSYADIQPIAERIDALLQRGGVSSVVDTVVIQGIYREQALKYSEVAENARYTHLGGMYRVFCYKS